MVAEVQKLSAIRAWCLPSDAAIGRSQLPSADLAIGAPFAPRSGRCAAQRRGERGTPVPLKVRGISISR